MINQDCRILGKIIRVPSVGICDPVTSRKALKGEKENGRKVFKMCGSGGYFLNGFE